MNKFKTKASVFGAVMILLTLAAFSPDGPQTDHGLRAGTAKIMITPGTPIPMSGYGGRKEPFKGEAPHVGGARFHPLPAASLLRLAA